MHWVPKTEQARLEEQLDRSVRLSGWHAGLDTRHQGKATRLEQRLAKMKTAATTTHEQEASMKDLEVTEDTPVEEIELTEEQQAAALAIALEFGAHLLLGDGADPTLQSVNETLMPGGAVVTTEEFEDLMAELPTDLAGATVVKTLNEKRVRYDFSVAVSRIELDVEKKVVVKPDGERTVVVASTAAFGPPDRKSVV